MRVRGSNPLGATQSIGEILYRIRVSVATARNLEPLYQFLSLNLNIGIPEAFSHAIKIYDGLVPYFPNKRISENYTLEEASFIKNKLQSLGYHASLEEIDATV